MKKTLLALLIAVNLGASAQNVDLRRKIEVSGVAEAEVTPDIIYFGISLKEYMDGKNRVSIDVLEKQLEKAIAEAGIPKEDFTINNASSYTYYQRKQDVNFLAAKQYRIKLHNLNAINKVLSSLDEKGIQNTGVESSEYSKAPALKKELKLKALLAAKEKATYLLAGIGEKLGGVIDVNEMDTNTGYGYFTPQSNTSIGYLSMSDAQKTDIGYRTIKLSFQVKAVFEIVN
ncbi:MAG: SIMPL domain-containing protein [Mucilaginibacter sp.]|uniref:SIMPL domain-containing protein n=1 Tax=Mucilaginibacter sp. TaxID=1882438 RepID=UPI003267AE29